jgi:peptidoglycan/LPS O-acetylase OafA/YrhL
LWGGILRQSAIAQVEKRMTSTFASSMIPQDRLLPGLLGLRGIAAFAVVLFHLVHLTNIAVPPVFSFVAADFGKGVQLFFVLSAFSLMHSTEHTLHRPTWAKEYFVRRFFRIAPLFYCILAVMVLWPALKAQHLTVSLSALLLNLTFTFGFAPWTGIVWAGWTVGVEMMFYAILPVLLLTVRSSKGLLMLVVGSMLFTFAARAELQAHYEHTVSLYRYNWSGFSFASNACYFALGMYAFRIASEIGDNATAMRQGVPVFTSVLLLALLLAGGGTGWRPDKILWGFGFALLALWQSKWPIHWCANRLFEYLGERSYSIYLLHPIVIILLKLPLETVYGLLLPTLGAYAYFVCAVALLAPLLLLSEVTYRLVEIPAIRYGKQVSARLRQQTNLESPLTQNRTNQAR